jgi:hypothetical protein
MGNVGRHDFEWRYTPLPAGATGVTALRTTNAQPVLRYTVVENDDVGPWFDGGAYNEEPQTADGVFQVVRVNATNISESPQQIGRDLVVQAFTPNGVVRVNVAEGPTDSRNKLALGPRLGKCPPTGCPQPVRSILQSCSYTNCHASGSNGVSTIGPAAGLDLSTPELIRLTAIGRVAHQTQTGEHASLPDRNPARFGRAMPIIDPQNAGNSYLLYKVIAHTGFAGVITDADPAELVRLRNAVVVGMQMPPPQAAGGLGQRDSTPVTDYDTLSAWISQGAKAPTCN